MVSLGVHGDAPQDVDTAQVHDELVRAELLDGLVGAVGDAALLGEPVGGAVTTNKSVFPSFGRFLCLACALICSCH